MNDQPDSLENLWEQLLSRIPSQVQKAFAGLSPQEREAVLAHLERMVGGPGWHREQRISARAALEALQKKGPGYQD